MMLGVLHNTSLPRSILGEPPLKRAEQFVRSAN